MSDNSFDHIEVRRPELAASFLRLLDAQPGRPLAMFAPRRVGKTHFLDNDLAPAALRHGWLPVYADLWLQKSAPMEAINHALEEALDDATVPARAAGRLARTPVRKLGMLGASIDLGDIPTRRPLPAAPEPRFDALVTRLAAAAGKPVLLMLDEIQSLGDVAQGEAVVAALRAVLHKRRAIVKAVFTGSSQEALARMLSTAGAPMYQFAQMVDFPVLGEQFLRKLANHFSKVHPGKELRLDELVATFERIGFKPGLMRDIVRSMSAEGLTDMTLGVARFLADERQAGGWRALLQPFDAFDRAVLLVLANGLPPLGAAASAVITRMAHMPPTQGKVRASIERLRRAGLVAKAGARGTAIADPLFAEFLKTQTPPGWA